MCLRHRCASKTQNFQNAVDEDDRLHEACGVFGVWAPGEDVARITYFGLYALQHRGQESAGIATTEGQRLNVFRRMGLVAQVFDEAALAGLQGPESLAAIGHTRYSTTGSNRACNSQPIEVSSPDLGPLALAHNGNIINALALKNRLQEQGASFEGTTDSEVIAQALVYTPGRDWVSRIRSLMPRLEGAYSLALLTPGAIYAVRDPFGIRPLCLGRLPHGAWVVASESCALQTVGAAFTREVKPGEIVQIDGSGLTTWETAPDHPQALCVFEYIYFARPDSKIGGRPNYLARQAMGRQLAIEQPADADIVIGVPDSAIPAAIGFAQQAGLPYTEGLVKNRYIGRTFIQPDQTMRARGVELKFNPLPEVLEGRRVVVVDDSIVRGTTTKPIVDLLRKAGAREVHVRIHSPAMRHPCYLGVDTARREELIAHRLNVAEICRHIGADSLGYLSLAGLFTAVAIDEGRGDTLCQGCFTGNYPMPVQMELPLNAKLALEVNEESPLPDHSADRIPRPVLVGVR
ncbi:MAG TPA: amidophosphoribosyltransferase [Chloroflexia bacterium]|nr:amidophosphoribosyltransferase [Chloroflexia bacterium]